MCFSGMFVKSHALKFLWPKQGSLAALGDPLSSPICRRSVAWPAMAATTRCPSSSTGTATSTGMSVGRKLSLLLRLAGKTPGQPELLSLECQPRPRPRPRPSPPLGGQDACSSDCSSGCSACSCGNHGVSPPAPPTGGQDAGAPLGGQDAGAPPGGRWSRLRAWRRGRWSRRGPLVLLNLAALRPLLPPAHSPPRLFPAPASRLAPPTSRGAQRPRRSPRFSTVHRFLLDGYTEAIEGRTRYRGASQPAVAAEDSVCRSVCHSV